MKLLLDQGLPRSAAGLLREAGIDTVHVSEIGYSTADDAAITPSVIRIRIEGLYGKKAADLIHAILTRCAEDLQQGAVVTVQPKRIRIRRLPVPA